MPDLDAKRERLTEYIAGFESCAVAFSAGVDSTVVACAAQQVLGDRAVEAGELALGAAHLGADLDFLVGEQA